jgi:hypothetical protein
LKAHAAEFEEDIMRTISDFSDVELDTFESRYRAAGKTDGGIFSLQEILLEKLKRKPSVFGIRETAARIVELCARSPDGLVTYGEIWKSFRPNSPWEGNKTQQIVANSLGRVVHYCVMHRLPILTVLVVRGGNRRLSQEAIANICNECRELGLDVDADAEQFIQRQSDLARAVVISQLPPEAI